MDNGDFDDWGPRYQPAPKEPDRVKVQSSGSMRDGHHYATFEIPVPKGVDPHEFANRISASIATSPAPFSPANVPSATPTPTRTIGMPSLVSKASSADGTEHNVQVEAMPKHILGGKGGTAAGINYGTRAERREDGTDVVVTEKESYGASKYSVLNPMRYFVGTHMLNPHMSRNMNEAYTAAAKPKEKEDA